VSAGGRHRQSLHPVFPISPLLLMQGRQTQGWVSKLSHSQQSTVNQIRRRSFRNVQVKPAGNNFSRCTECDFLRCCISKYPKDFPEWQALVDDRTRHINYQNACRSIYRGWSTQSVESPSQFLCIIHNKLDHTKTTIPRM
jgi:hypothetical protein